MQKIKLSDLIWKYPIETTLEVIEECNQLSESPDDDTFKIKIRKEKKDES